jgi:hypothetical protein
VFRLQGQLCHPVDGAQRRADLLSAAAAASPRLGGEILPHLLQPLQEHRYTAQQLLETLSVPSEPMVSTECTLAEADPAEFDPVYFPPRVSHNSGSAEGEGRKLDEQEDDGANDPELPTTADAIKLFVQQLRTGTEGATQKAAELLPQESNSDASN